MRATYPDAGSPLLTRRVLPLYGRTYPR